MTDNTDSVAQCRIDYEKKKMAELIFANEEMKIQLEEREDDLLAATQRAQKADALEEENLTLRQANSELRIQLEEKKKQHEALERANANMASVMSLIQQMNVRVAAIGERQDHLADHHQHSGEESRDDQLRALTSQCESLGTQLNQWMAQSGESGENLPQELETMKEECVQLRASLQMEKHEHRCAQQRVHELKEELARLETTHAAKFQALHQQHQQTHQENKTRMDAQADQNAELLSQLALLQYARDASPSASGDQQTLRVGSSASMTETMEVGVDEHRSIHSLHQVRETMQQRMDILASSDQNSLPKAEVIALVQEMLDAQEAYSNTMQSEMFIQRIQAKEREESLRKYIRRISCEKLNLEKLLTLKATDAHAAHVAATPPRHGQAAEAHRQNTTTNAEMHDLWSRTPPRVQQHEDPSNSSVYELWRTHTTAAHQHADAQVRCPDCLFPQARGRTTCEACHHAL